MHQTRSGIACASIGGQQVISIGVGGVRSEARRAKRCERTIFVRLPFEMSQLARKTLKKYAGGTFEICIIMRARSVS